MTLDSEQLGGKAAVPPLGRQTIQNVGIVYVLSAASRGVSVIALVVLARLLLPHDFGVVAVSGLIISIVALFKDFGLGAALIQRETDAQAAAATAFWATLLMRLVLYSILVLMAPLVAAFFQEPALNIIVPIAGLGLLFEGLGAINVAFLMKRLEFGKLSIVEGSNLVITTVASIILAVAGFSYWSLVLGSLANAPLNVWLLWRFDPWRPSRNFDRRHLRNLIGYGKHVVLINSAGFAVKNLDSLTVAKVLGAINLGIYSFAGKFGLFSSTTLGAPIARVLFPTYARIQNDANRVKSGYVRTMFPISVVAFPVCVVTLVIPDLLVNYLLGSGWESVAGPLRILGLSGLMATLAGPSWNVFLALGHPELGSHTVLIQLIVISVLAVPGAIYGGLLGVAVAATIAIGSGSVYQIFEADRLLAIKASGWLRVFGPPVVGSAVMGAILLTARQISPSSILGLLLLVSAGITSYVVVTELASSGRLSGQVIEIVSALRRPPA